MAHLTLISTLNTAQLCSFDFLAFKSLSILTLEHLDISPLKVKKISKE